ncbi:D-alanyl-D-alanine carboxypeptidase [Sphingorhabdus soli]|uniref:serine-type D-Ala-D-Ala carboxypeptidase n=1 Tax=Flavisphingopyxis soli TaxID=2601267 RepID=A0A5C6U813_9SPHN|nr:D-alanyl-D-alanine carboxypeptidase family protein [Sphingorhabdus soli]TXC69167.1 D-alanyl-D-alanine carboxypeptidase [Sphingorhabdus soli]
MTIISRLAASSAFVALLALPASAAAPPYDSEAPIAYMIDLSSNAVLFSRDADRRIPPASMTKMMSVYVAFDLISRGELSLDKKITVRPETWQKWHGPSAGSTMFLSPGEQVSVRNLLDGIVTLSGNDACIVLAEGIAGTEEAFAGLMNQKAKELGLKNSHFGNSMGWPDEGVTYSSAHDLATIAATTIEKFPRLYSEFYGLREFSWGKTMGGEAISQGNRNPLLGKVAGADGLKTGHTEEAGYGFTGSAEQNGRRIVMVIAGLDSFGGRAKESVRFMDWGFRAWQTKPLFDKGAVVGTAQVQMGDSATVELKAPRNLAVTVPSGTSPNVTMSIAYNGPVKAPFKAGDAIAQLVVRTPDMPVQTMPLVAAETVDEAGFFRRAWVGFTSLFT